MNDVSSSRHDAQHPAIDVQRPWIEAARESTVNLTFQDPICQYPGCGNPTVAYINPTIANAAALDAGRFEARCADHGGRVWEFTLAVHANTKDGKLEHETMGKHSFVESTKIPASTEDQWAALATDNGRLLTEALMKLAAAETQRLAYAKQVALATEALRKEHAAKVAEAEQMAVVADLERGACAGLLKLTTAKLAEVETELSNETIAWLKLDGRWARAVRWAWSFRRRLEEKTWEAEGWRIKASGTEHKLEGATARERAAREVAKKAEEWQSSVSSALRSWDLFESGQWAGDKNGWGYHFELIRFLIRHYEATKEHPDRLARPIPPPQPATDE